jgi:hypothetical protein
VVLLVVAIAERADFLFGLLPYSLLSLFRKHAWVVQRLHDDVVGQFIA